MLDARIGMGPAARMEAPIAHVVDETRTEVLDLMGPVVQFLTPPDEEAPCVMRGTIPPGAWVPLHSHPDSETFAMLSGEVEGLAYSGDRFEWVRINPGDVFHVPGDTEHAFRNRGTEPAVLILINTMIGRFFREIGARPAPRGAASPASSEERMRHFFETAERYGHRNASPEENARVGLPAKIA
jgi:quercetin dioxygenase-like cupin family protein